MANNVLNILVVDFDCLTTRVIEHINTTRSVVFVVNEAKKLQGTGKRLEAVIRGTSYYSYAPDTTTEEHSQEQRLVIELKEKIPHLWGYLISDKKKFSFMYFLPANETDSVAVYSWPLCQPRADNCNHIPAFEPCQDLPNKPKGYAIQNKVKTESRAKGKTVTYTCVSDKQVFLEWAKNMKWDYKQVKDF